MRAPERIYPFLEQFGIIWSKNPDLRFGQIILDLQSYLNETYQDTAPDLFYLEEDEFLKYFSEFTDCYLTTLNIE